MTPARTPRRRGRVGVLLVLILLVAACAGRKSAPPITTAPPTTRPTTTTQPPGPGIEGAAPLTGLPFDDEAAADRPAVAVKYGNLDGKATPQAGVNEADLVYELQVEGQVTRLLAVFQSTDAVDIGPVRSARLSELPLLEELNHPLFVWHGANARMGAVVRGADVVRASIDDVPSLFYRDRSRPGPHNSFAIGTAAIREARAGDAGPPPPLFFYRTSDAGLSPHAVPARHLGIRFGVPFGRSGGEAPVEYDWDDDTAVWRRSQAGHPHVDADGLQVAVPNVIVRFTDYVASGSVDISDAVVPTAEVVGQGDAWVFSGGTVTEGTWIKSDNHTPTRYVDADGRDIRLAPGRTWITLPVGTNVTHR